MRASALVCLAVVASLTVSRALALDETPPAPGEVRTVQPSPRPPDRTVRTGSALAAAPRSGDSAQAGALKGCRALAVTAGEARVTLADGSARTLRPGDVVGSDTVETIEPGRILLRRLAVGERAVVEGTVVITFDGAGRSRTRVYLTTDPTSKPAPEVR